MRNLSILLVIVALIGAGLFYYNTSSYEPSTGRVYPSLPEQKFDDVELNKEKKDKEKSIEDLNISEERIKASRAWVSAAIEDYKQLYGNLPKQAQGTMGLLIHLMSKGKLPSHFVDVKMSGYEQDPYFAEQLSFDPFNASHLRLTRGRTMCTDVQYSSGDKITSRYKVVRDDEGRPSYQCVDDKCPKAEHYDIMIGDILANKFLCEPKLPPLKGDKIYLGGPGDDAIKHTAGAVIVDGGTGNDVITLGQGRKIIIFSQGWGQDKVSLDCSGAEISRAKLPKTPIPWGFEYGNFVIFGNTIKPEDLRFNGLEIEHAPTGDKVTFNNYCFNTIFTEDFADFGIPEKVN